jgi:hypothetical protein
MSEHVPAAAVEESDRDLLNQALVRLAFVERCQRAAEERLGALEGHPAVSVPPLVRDVPQDMPQMRPGEVTWTEGDPGKATIRRAGLPPRLFHMMRIEELADALENAQRMVERAEKYAEAVNAQHKEAVIRLSEARQAAGVAADALIIAASCPSSTRKDAP